MRQLRIPKAPGPGTISSQIASCVSNSVFALALIETLPVDEVVKQYQFDQSLWPGVFEVAVAPMYNPTLVASWDLAPPGNNRVGGVKHPEFIVLK